MSVFSKTVAERTRPGQRQDVEEQSYTFHAYARSEGVAGIIISDHEYPALVAHQLLSKILDEFTTRYPRSAWENSNGDVPFPQLKEYIQKYQDPQQADSIMKVRTTTPVSSRWEKGVADTANLILKRSKKNSTKPKSSSTKPSNPYWSAARKSTAS